VENKGLTIVESKPSGDTASLEVMARLKDVKLDVKTLVGRWLFISYDIPVTKEGNEARAQFYRDAYAIGAVAFNESLYFMPWSAGAEKIAMELSKTGNVVIIPSSEVDPTMQEKFTRKYDAGVLARVKEISERIDKIAKQVEMEHEKRADKMAAKTWKMIDAVEKAIVSRGSTSLFLTLALARARLTRLAV